MQQQVVPYQAHSFGEAMRIGEVLAESGFFEDTPTAAKAVVKMLAGKELGFGPIASMTGVDVIQGQVAIKPRLMASAIQRSGRFAYRVREHDAQHCRIEFFDGGESVGFASFSMEDAKAAGLAGKQSWRQYPRNMLAWRAMSVGANLYCPAIFGGPVYTPEELGAEVDAEGEVVAQPPAPRGAKDETPRSASAYTPAPASADPRTLDDAIKAGEVGGLEEGPETPSAGTEPAGDESPAPTAPAPAAGNGGPARGPAAVAAELGITESAQRLILLTVGGLEDASDLQEAYRQVPVDRQDAVAEALARKAGAVS